MSIKKLQEQLGVTVDGIWGKQSQSAFETKQIKLNFDVIRSQFGRLNQSQVDGFNEIMSAINADSRVKNPLYIAYMLATTWHETAHTMKPIEEYGKGRGRKYGQNIDINGSRYHNLPHIYYGRGYVQLTWLANYVKMGKKLDVDLVNNPKLALDPTYASKIMIEGMLDGLFTGRKLSMIKSEKDFVNARAIINGRDKAKHIAYQAQAFLSAIGV